MCKKLHIYEDDTIIYINVVQVENAINNNNRFFNNFTKHIIQTHVMLPQMWPAHWSSYIDW